MEKIERLVRVVTHIALAALAAILCVRLCTGCMAIREAASKERIAETVKTAYDVGGREIVSNRIERLVTDGKVTDEQAAYLHAAVRCAEEALLRRVAEGEARAEGAQAAAAVYERTVDRLVPTNAPAAKAD